jgi:hypothetical protein
MAPPGANPMSPGGHLVTTAIVGGAVYAATGSLPLVAGLAAGGFLIDVDHMVDYVAFEGRRDLRPGAFLRYYLSGRAKRVVLMLHSYELMVLLGLVAWATGWVPLWGYILGMALHLPLDIVFNGRVAGHSLVAFYSFLYRWRAGFRADELFRSGPVRPAGAGFWTAFFVGAVRADGQPGKGAARGRQPREHSRTRAAAV